MKNNLINIYKAFFKIGLILLGGGYVIVPVVRDELIEKRNWILEEELLDYYCIAQSLPGIIAINTSILIGYRLSKIKGVLMCLLGLMTSPIISIILIANIIKNLMHIGFIQGIFWGVNLSVIILIYITLKDIWKKSIYDKKLLFWFIFILILSLLKINPIYLIIFSVIIGVLSELRKKNQND